MPRGGKRAGAGRRPGHTAPVKARLAGHARALEAVEATAERTMREIAAVGFSRIGAIFDEHGNLQHPQQLPDHVQATIASVKTLKTNVVSGDGQQETTREVKLWDKMSALNLLAKHFNLVSDKLDVNLSADAQLLSVLDAFKIRNRQP